MKARRWSTTEKEALRRDALRYVIPHFASNAELAKGPKILVRGEGCYVYDLDGNRYLDTFATLLTTVCGHCRPEVNRVVAEQMAMLEFFPNYVDTFTVPLIELSRKLAELLPGDLSVSFYVNSGSEANETALKMVRQYHVECGQRQRFKFIARRDSYHATTLGGGAVTGLRWFREHFEPLMPGAVFVRAARERDCPPGTSSEAYGRECLDELEETIRYEGPDSIAGMMMDPIPGSNTGFPLPPEGYLQGVRRLCDKYGILLIFDEVQTGFGKTGKWFACEHWGVVPDVMTLGKGFSGGFIPLGATVTTPKVAEVFRRGPGCELRSGSTYGGHTVACAATLENLRLIEREHLVENAARLGTYMRSRLEAMMKRRRIIGEVSGLGLLLAVRLLADRKAQTPLDPGLGVGTWVRDWCFNHGLILRNNGDILVLAPPLIITQAEADLILDGIDQAVAAATKALKL